MEKIIIAYCRDNMELARTLDQQLSTIGIAFEHLTNMPGATAGDFASQLHNTNSPVLLLITDNFLRNLNCLYGTTAIIKSKIIDNQLIPIVADGIKTEANQQNTEKVPTRFDRVIHAIQYLNHWQNASLEASAQIEQTPTSQKQEAEIQVEKIKKTSSEIGDLLNFVRENEYFIWDDFVKNDFLLFFKQFGIQEWHPQYVEINKKSSKHTEITAFVTAEAIENIPTSEPISVYEGTRQTSSALSVLEGIGATEHTHLEPDLAQSATASDQTQPPKHDLVGESISEVDFSDQINAQGPFGLKDQIANETNQIAHEEPGPDLQTQKSVQFGVTSPIDIPLPDPYLEDQLQEKAYNNLQSIIDEIELEEMMIQGVRLNQEVPEEISLPPDVETQPTAAAETVLAQDQNKHYIYTIQNEKNRISALIHLGEQADGVHAARLLHESHPNDDALRFFYVQILALHSDQNAEANLQIQELQKLDFPASQILELRGDLALKAAEPLQAKDWWDAALLEDPDAIQIHMKLGNLLETYFRGSKKTAGVHYKIAADLSDLDPVPSLKYANLMLEYLDKPKKALKYYARATQIAPNNSEAWYGLALSSHHSGHPELATEAYKKAISIDTKLKSDTLDKLFLKNQLETSYHQPATEGENEQKQEEQTILTVLITGASSGIGLATAKYFADQGHRIIVTGRRNDRLDELKADLDLPDGQIHLAPFDVRDLGAVQQFVDDLPEAWRDIDVLINNAGLAQGLSFIHEADIKDWDTMIDTNIKGLLYMTRAIAPLMVARKHGHIINVSSSAGKEVYPKGNVYCATKSAVEALTKGMRLDLHNHGIRVSQVSPGHVEETEFALTRFHGDAERANIYTDFQPLKAIDVAEAIYFMVTRPSHVNIQDIQMFGTQQASSTVIDRSGR
jgi:NADP-dependent 3-hydroxy acid dehydrogenase YdfG